jgi:conjugative transfer signal peptidase TraF
MSTVSQRVWRFGAIASLSQASAPITLVALIVATGLIARSQPPVFRWNVTPSEPEGLYVRASRTPVRTGELVTFLAPPSAFPYADKRLSALHREPILKAVAASAGDRVCAADGVLRINGKTLAPIAEHDSHGDMLPHWAQCRRLRRGEVFVFSNRVRDSFDSRYYGPIRSASAQVYRPLVTVNGFWR